MTTCCLFLVKSGFFNRTLLYGENPLKKDKDVFDPSLEGWTSFCVLGWLCDLCILMKV
jgi:hypothetical protein